MRHFTYLYSLSPAGAVSVYLFIATVYSVANWYVYCRSIFHIEVCHTYYLFPLVFKIWKSSFFLHFSNISYVSNFFGIIIRKVNITSTEAILMSSHNRLASRLTEAILMSSHNIPFLI